MKILQICPPHLSDVATLPWEIQKVILVVYHNRCATRVCCKSARHWLTGAHSNSAQMTDGCGVGNRDTWQLLCFRCMQAITADTVIAHITHDDRPNISLASRRHGATRRGTEREKMADFYIKHRARRRSVQNPRRCISQMHLVVVLCLDDRRRRRIIARIDFHRSPARRAFACVKY